jgi:DNA-binding response OmpR family regulator
MKPLKILVIEDDAFFSGMLVRFIQQIDAGVIVEVHAGTLEDLFVNTGGWQPDVLLVDLDIPGLNNLSRISYSRKILPQVLIIAMGMIGDVSYRALALANGADDYLDKNSLSNELFPLLSHHLSLKISVKVSE